MSTFTVLDEAEKRFPAEAERRHALHGEIVEAIREEIGTTHYASAKSWLLKQEQAIEKIYRPFLNRLLGLQAQTTVPLPAEAARWLKELGDLCLVAPRQLRDGLTGWEKLTPPFGPNGQDLDLNLRGLWVTGIRQCFLSGEGCYLRLEALKAAIEAEIDRHHWPARIGG